jgi:hypothetical protein
VPESGRAVKRLESPVESEYRGIGKRLTSRSLLKFCAIFSDCLNFDQVNMRTECADGAGVTTAMESLAGCRYNELARCRMLG